jgi:hypothetical protein
VQFKGGKQQYCKKTVANSTITLYAHRAQQITAEDSLKQKQPRFKKNNCYKIIMERTSVSNEENPHCVTEYAKQNLMEKLK